MKTDSPSARTSRRSAGLHSILNLVLVFAILVMVNYLGFKYYKHRDLSQSQFYTLSPKTVEVLKKLDGPLHIYTFIDPKNPGQADQIETLLKEYQQVGGKNVEVEKIDSAYDYARAIALQKELHFDANDHLLIFKYKKDGTPLFVRQDDLYDLNPMTQQVGAFKGEQQITATILVLEEGKASHIYFTQGHGEHRLQDTTTASGYGFIAANLKTENIVASDVSLAQKGEVPADADAVIIAGPSIAFSPLEVEILDKYLAANGKLFVLVDPYVSSGLNDLLKKYGMQFDDDLVLYRGMTTAGTQMTFSLALILQTGFSTQPITAKFAQAGYQLQFQNVRSISLTPTDKDNPKTQALLQTDSSSWGWTSKNGAAAIDPQQLIYNKVTDLPGPLVIAAQYDGGTMTDPVTKATVTATRVVAIGTSRFIQNDAYDGSVAANLFTNCIDWLVKKNAVLEISPKKPQQYGVSLSPMQFRTVVWCALFFIPGTALALGILTWLSRRK